jgi:Tfp pilus assembly pilus retraction ATPase PilT
LGPSRASDQTTIQSHGMAAVFRTIPATIKTLDELNLPVLKT